jgi:hypothetical protein
VLLGRYIFDSYLTPNRKVHDIYSFVLGLYVMWLSAVIIDWVIKKQKALADNDWAIDWAASKEKAVKYISVVSLKTKKHFVFVIIPTHSYALSNRLSN